jgi:hypothetical protein
MSTGNTDNVATINGSTEMNEKNESSPLLEHQTSTASTRSVDSTAGEGVIRFSSHWLNTANLDSEEKFASERNRAIEAGVVKAAFLIRDAVLGESENPSSGTYDPYANPENSIRNLASLIFRQILCSRLLRQVLLCSVWALALLTFVEPPRWCNERLVGDDSKVCSVVFNLKGPAATNQNDTNLMVAEEDYVDYYPSSKSVLLNNEESEYIELILVSFVSMVILFRIGRDGCSVLRYLRKGPALNVRLLQIFAIAGIYFGLWSGFTPFQPFARLLLLGTFLKSLHQEIATCFEVVGTSQLVCLRGSGALLVAPKILTHLVHLTLLYYSCHKCSISSLCFLSTWYFGLFLAL